MSHTDARGQLAEQQAALVRSLVGDGATLPGFDIERLQATSAALLSKRRQEVAHTWPALTAALAERFPPLFVEYAGLTPMPKTGGPRADGRAFARFLAKKRVLPDEGRLETLRVDLHFQTTASGLRRRRGPTLQIAWLRDARRVVAALRLPLLGERWLRLPW
jgi:hypothetical protein